MADEIVKLEANSKGVWITALSDELTLSRVLNVLRAQGVRKYDQKAVEEFVKQKNREPQKIALRDEKEEKNALITVQIDKDSMSATVSVEPPFFTKPWPTQGEIQESLQRKNVVFGIKEEAIAELVNLKLSETTVVAAEGKPPLNGVNSRIELLVDPDQAPQVDEEAQKVDHRTRSVFVNVREGDEIAVKHPATEGENGMTVTGKELKAVAGKDFPFPVTTGFKTSEDGLHLFAAIDGRILRKDNKLVVLPELDVRGDVDFSVGHIDFTGNVKVSGAVREGFRVFATGFVEVREMVEGAHIESSADVIIHGGVRGMNKGKIIAAGNVTAGFVDQAYIRSQGSVKVKNSMFHSDVGAQQSVEVVGGQKSQIAGGKIQAGVEVVCQVLGSEMGTKTEVIVGIPPEQAERRKELVTQVAQYKENLEKVEANLGFLKKLEHTGSLDDDKRALLMNVTKTKFHMQAELNSMSAELKDIEERLELSKSKGVVRVRDVCYPGVSVTIRGSVYVVKEPLKFTSFIIDEGEIRLRSFDY